MNKMKSRIVACLLLVLATGHCLASEVEYRRPSSGEGLYEESDIDLRVKVLGGEILLRREVTGLKWEINRAWADLGRVSTQTSNQFVSFASGSSSGGSSGALNALATQSLESAASVPKKLFRNGYVYELQSGSAPSVWSNGVERTITAIDEGYRWQDRSGEWIEYDNNGRMTRFGNLTGLLGRVTRNSNNQIEKVYDRKDHLIMTFTYDAAGRLAQVMDRVERTVSYQWDGDKLAKVVDALGGEWRYQYDNVSMPYFSSWPRISAQTLSGQAINNSESFTVLKQITDPEGRVTMLDNLVHGGNVIMQCFGSGGSSGSRIVEKTDPDTGVTTVSRETYSIGGGKMICMQYTTPRQIVLRSITDSDGQTTSFSTAYDASSETYTSKKQNPDGSTTERMLDKEGKTGTLYRGGELVYSRVKEGQTEIQYDSSGNRTQISYDKWDNPTHISYADGSSVSMSYHGKYNFPLSVTNENGVVTEYRYNSAGQLLKVIEARGLAEQRTIQFTYNDEGLVDEKQLSGAGNVSLTHKYEYDEFGNITRIITNNSVSQQFADYTVTGQPQTMIDAAANEWRYSYNAEGRLLTQTDPLTHGQRYTYDKNNNLVAYADGKNKVWQLAYDAQNRVKSVTDPFNQSRSFTYNSEGLPTSFSDEEKHVEKLIYDSAGRLQKQLDGVGNTKRYQFGFDSVSRSGGFGLLTELSAPTYSEKYGYDKRNRQISRTKTVGGNALTDEFGYDKLGQLTSSRDANGRETRLEYDALGNITLANNEGAISKAQYDALGNLLEFTDPVGGRWIFSYDSVGRRKSLSRPGFGQWSYDYTPTGKLETIVDARGQAQRFEYDAAGRMTARHFFANSEEAQQPEKALKTISYGYDANNRLTSWDDGKIKGTLAYDDAGRLLGETINYGTFSRGYRYSYYANGLKKSLTTNDGTVVSYQYDAGNKLTKVSLPGVGSVSINEYNWLAPTQIQYPGGSQKSIAYTELLEPKTMAVSDINGKSVASIGYEYGKAREILSSSKDGLTTDYGYNERYALTSAKESQQDKSGSTTQGREFSYQLDANANRIAENDDSDWQYQDGKLLKAKGHSYEYDANGNQIKERYELLGKPTLREFGYDGDNRLLWVKENGTVLARYSYDPFGRRLSKEINGKITYFIYSTEGLLAELDSDGNEQVGYGFRPQGIWGTDPLYLRAAGKYYYYQNDHLGTPYRIVDGTGFIVWSALQDPFGKMAVAPGSTLTNNLRFPGQYYDAETGLHYNWNRYYQVEIGRYIGSDPVGVKGGSNAYAYAMAMVLKQIDPFGLMTLCEALKKIQANPNQFTDGSDFYTSEITQEQDVLNNLGIPYTVDGVDLQYFLVMYNMTESTDRVTGLAAGIFVSYYVLIGSAVSANTLDGYIDDTAADMRGWQAGYDAGVVGLDNYIEQVCDDDC